jgi:tetratricopeptide (TPR) repeat protein
VNNSAIKPELRFFVSFSSRDKAAAREIMSGLRSQQYYFWDYSNEIEAMKFTDEVKTRILEEIDRSDYFIAMVSKDSTHENTGHFTRFEVEYATVTRKMHLEGRIFIIELEDAKRSDYIGPYELLKGYLHVDFVWNSYSGKNIQSYISILKKICQITGREYIPQITPHARLPFWEKFRDEVISFVHSNSTHVHLNGILGEFNEYFKMGDYLQAFNAIQYFIVSCNYLIPEYKMVYPWIVRAVTEQELGKHSDAKLSYEAALVSDPGNPIALGGIGMVYQLGGNFIQAVRYFGEAVENSKGVQAINERLNLIVSKLSGQIPLTSEEQFFIRNLNVDEVVTLDWEDLHDKGIFRTETDPVRKAETEGRLEEQRHRVLLTKALFYFFEASKTEGPNPERRSREMLEKAWDIYTIQVTEDKIWVTAHITYFYMTAVYLNKPNPSDILIRAIDRPDPEKKLDKQFLYGYLAEHYSSQNKPFKSIGIYEKWLINDNPTKRTLLFYAIALRNAGRPNYKDVCKKILNSEEFGLPSTPEDFYWNGFANYLLENSSRAHYDFERSNHFQPWYPDIYDISG